MRLHRSVVFPAAALLAFASLTALHSLPGIQAAGLPAAGGQAAVSQGAGTAARVPVLVELFTSEGCSSCPHADALLARLDREQPIPNADILVLGEHVDYWDGLGWKDRFSSSELTERQRDYQTFFHADDIYTPQTVVQGSSQFNGTDVAGISRAISRAAQTPPVPLQLKQVAVHGNTVSFSLQNGAETPGDGNVYAALVDPVDSTHVLAGENSGRSLAHAGVVRALSRVGGPGRINASGERPFTFQAHIPQPPAAFVGMRLVVFLQSKRAGPILGAIACTLGPAGAPAPYQACPAAPGV